jgi:RPA family protein
MEIKRQTAYKLWISSINNSSFVKTLEEFSPNYIDFNNKKISRVNLIGTVINRYENLNYVSLIIDDSSSQISVKAWNEDSVLLKNINVSDIILVIGKLKQSSLNSSIYVLPEIAKQVDLNYELLRKLELIKEFGKPLIEESKKEEIPDNKDDKNNKETYVEEIKVSNSLRQQVLNTIEKLESDEGITLSEISEELKEEEININEILEELIKEGEIFQIKNRFKII